MENNNTTHKTNRSFVLFGILYVVLCIGVCLTFALAMLGIIYDTDNIVRLKYARYLYFSLVTSIFFFPFTDNSNEKYHPPIFSILCIVANSQERINGKQTLISILALLLIAMGAEIPRIVFGE